MVRITPEQRKSLVWSHSYHTDMGKQRNAFLYPMDSMSAFDSSYLHEKEHLTGCTLMLLLITVVNDI